MTWGHAFVLMDCPLESELPPKALVPSADALNEMRTVDPKLRARNHAKFLWGSSILTLILIL
jgi:hypothetical protein